MYFFWSVETRDQRVIIQSKSIIYFFWENVEIGNEGLHLACMFEGSSTNFKQIN